MWQGIPQTIIVIYQSKKLGNKEAGMAFWNNLIWI